MTPSVSVIIPTFNRKCLIIETIESVLAQTFGDFEIIVVDNGGTDDTASVIEQFNDSRIRYHWQEPTGRPAPPRNKGLQMARGKYIGFLDSDDLWIENKLESQLAMFENNPALKWVYCKVAGFDHVTGNVKESNSGEVYYEGDVCHQLIRHNFIPSASPLIRKTVFNVVGEFNENPILFAREDWELWLRIAAIYPIGFVSEVLAKYRIHSDAISMNSKYMLKKYYGRIAAICSAASFAPQKYECDYLTAIETHTLKYIKYFILNGESKTAQKIITNYIAQTRQSGKFWFLRVISKIPTKYIKLAHNFVRS